MEASPPPASARGRARRTWGGLLPGSRFLWRLYGSYAGLILIATASLGWLVARRIERDSLAEVERELRDKAQLLSEQARASLVGAPPPDLEERVLRWVEGSDTRVTLILVDGRVVADSERDASSLDNHSQRPEIAHAREDGYGTAIRFSDTLQQPQMYVALPLLNDGALVGYVRCAVALAVIDQRLAELRGMVVIAAVLSALVALVLGYLVWRRIARPLLALSDAAEAFARGDVSQRVRYGPRDEIGHLARTFNAMADQLRERMAIITTDRNKLLAILSGMVEGVVAVDKDQKVLHMNDVAGQLLDVSPAASLGKSIGDVSPVADIRQALLSALSAGQHSAELSLTHSGREQFVNLRAAALVDADGNRAGAVVVLHDVTELRLLPAMRRDFVANVSHELKTPITAIRALVETLIDDPAMASGIRARFLRKIKNQSLRLSTLVSDLLSLSRIESQTHTEADLLDLRDPLRSAAASHLPNFEHKDVRLRVSLPETAVETYGDLEGLRQIANNLLENAFNYTHPGGEVRLRLTVEGARAHIEVSDTGIGIDRKHHARIFERFYRVDKARSRELGGTGLGLSIVKHLTLAHGGELAVESQPGKGSTFRVTLPLRGKPD